MTVYSCRECGVPVVYILTPKGRKQCVEAKPNRKGNVTIVDGFATVVAREGLAEFKGVLYMPHHHGKPERPQGLTAITGLSVLDEIDRLARELMRVATSITHRKDPDVNDCRAAWHYFIGRNPGVPRANHLAIQSRAVRIIEERDRPAEQRAQA